MSANLVVDLGLTCDYRPSLALANLGSVSGITVGAIVDLSDANTNCNIFAAGNGSGVVGLQVQTSDSLTSGSFTDPTSGLPRTALPAFLASGGVMFVNSGLHVSGRGSLSSPVNNAPLFCSGGIQFGAFQRIHRYARLIAQSGTAANTLHTAGFISQKRTTGSGGGFSFAPGSGTVSV